MRCLLWNHFSHISFLTYTYFWFLTEYKGFYMFGVPKDIYCFWVKVFFPLALNFLGYVSEGNPEVRNCNEKLLCLFSYLRSLFLIHSFLCSLFPDRTKMPMYAKVTDWFLLKFVYKFVWVACSSYHNRFLLMFFYYRWTDIGLGKSSFL